MARQKERNAIIAGVAAVLAGIGITGTAAAQNGPVFRRHPSRRQLPSSRNSQAARNASESSAALRSVRDAGLNSSVSRADFAQLWEIASRDRTAFSKAS